MPGKEARKCLYELFQNRFVHLQVRQREVYIWMYTVQNEVLSVEAKLELKRCIYRSTTL